ncbi:glycosyltransferase family 39 protein [Paenibacillus hemerocallicola]|uniref:Glycosyltransferase family 39 protein n=1 Tax=Paenibacillus hemerocallicola TaxID=1172614 RepID=A0A5C4T8Q7_9BACL|nr:glycosyltransferase family 39 protein [Paenibacillus hemerocallicola]TNJ65322.1 glycosyltransferase family 39 protein [Paenibacillus hemerocallicola]
MLVLELLYNVYRWICKFKNQELVYLIPLVILSLFTSLGYFFTVMFSEEGFPTSDDSKWYLDYAYAMIADFKIGLHMNDIMYFGYNMLLTVLLAVFKNPVAVLFIQSVATGLSVILVYKIAHMLFNRTTAVIASLLYSVSEGVHRWTVYILTDSLYISLLLLCVYLLLKCFETGEKRYKLLFAAISLYIFVFRPAGIITLAFILLYILIRLRRTTVTGFIKRYRLALGGTVVVLLAVGVYALTGNRLDPLLASMEENAKLVLYNIYATGSIYDKPTPYDYRFNPDYTIDVMNSVIVSFFVHNWDQILALYGKRSVSFLGWWVWKTDYRSVVSLAKLVLNELATVLFFAGTVAAIVNKQFRKASVVWLVIFSVFVFCVIFFIDIMYRYKAPSLPFIAIVSAYGAERIIRGCLVLVKKWRRSRQETN